MRVFVLALDGLEYNLVVKWGLRYLMQKKYGYFQVSSKYFHRKVRVPYTPVIWTTFITGKEPEEHGIHEKWTYGRVWDFIKRLPIIKHIKGKRRIVWKLGIKPRIVSYKDLRSPTLFDLIAPSVAVNVPAYNDLTEYHTRLANALMKGLVEFEQEIWKIHWERRRATLSALRENVSWRLFMTYFDLADLAGHLYYVRQPEKLQHTYLELNSLAWELQKAIPEDTIFLIVSDHGMQPSEDGVSGEHSPRAFWSLNVEEKWAPTDFKDFFHKILEWVERD